MMNTDLNRIRSLLNIPKGAFLYDGKLMENERYGSCREWDAEIRTATEVDVAFFCLEQAIWKAEQAIQEEKEKQEYTRLKEIYG